MRSIELFTGVGGLAKGLHLSGFKHDLFVEFHKHACASLRLNYDPNLVAECDIRDFDFSKISKVELVAGGPPCQPFSLGGKHKAFNDSRDMFPHAIRAIHAINPRAFLFENVKGLMRSSFKDYFDYIIRRLKFPSVTIPRNGDWQGHNRILHALEEKKGSEPEYNVSFQLLNAANYGVPQTRERIVIVGIRSDIRTEWSFPKSTHTMERLVWDQWVSGEYWDKHKVSSKKIVKPTRRLKNLAETLKANYSLFSPTEKPWLTIRDALTGLPDPQAVHSISDHLFRAGAKTYPGHTGSCFDWPSKTIKAGVHGVPGGENMIRFADGSVRYLTVHEAKLVQTFPSDYLITGAWSEAMRQIGNAVPVILAKRLGEQLLKTLSESESKVTKVMQQEESLHLAV